MKLLRLCSSSNYYLWSSYNVIMSRVFKMELYSTRTQTNSDRKDALYKRISPEGNPMISIVPILDQWVEEGKAVNLRELKSIIMRLRHYNRYTHALQLSEWMNGRSYLDPSPADIAIQLGLVSEVHGLEQAEKYFYSIPETSRTLKIYGALLSCYARNKSLEKAETIMQKMRELGFLRTFSYNVMMDLYYKMGKHEKLDTLVQEMENMGISCHKSTFYIRMNACASVYDIEGMERLLKQMEADPQLTLDWNTYITAANGYVKGGLVEKAMAMLKKSEELITGKSRAVAYDTLLTLYASVGKKDEVYRVWAMYKKMVMIFNNGYAHMISSLVKLDDISGAEKILAEWESSNNSFDFQIPNFLINAYCKTGLFEKAEAFVSRVKGSDKEPPASTWDLLATAYHKDNQMEKAVESMRKAALAYWLDCKLNIVTLRACFKYLTKKGDVKLAGEFERLLVEHGEFPQKLPELQIMPKNEQLNYIQRWY